MYQYKLDDGTKITTLAPMDIENTLVKSMLEMMSKRANEAKNNHKIISSTNFRPLSGRRHEMARQSFEEYFSENYADDDIEE